MEALSEPANKVETTAFRSRQTKIGTYLNGLQNEKSGTQSFSLSFKNATEKYKDHTDTKTKESLQDHLVAILINEKRGIFQKEGKSGYDFEKERRQIDAIISILEGQHVHMGTGEGKSTVVLPIAAIVEALTSDKKAVILSSANMTLVDELRQNTATLLRSLADKTGVFGFDLTIPEIPAEKRPKIDELTNRPIFKTMIKEALTEGTYSEQTNQDFQVDFFNNAEPGKRTNIFEGNDGSVPRIAFVSHRQLIFDASEDKKVFHENSPRIFFDEAHSPYDTRGKPYEKVEGCQYATAEEIRASTLLWFTDFLIAKQLTDKDFYFESGRRYVREEAVARIKDGLLHPEAKYFNEAVDAISRHIGGLTPDERKKVMATLSGFMESGYLPVGKKKGYEGLKHYILNVGNNIGEINYYRNKSYVIDKEGRPIIRDSYIDELLESHQYSPFYQLDIYATNNRFHYVPINQSIFSSIKFPTFVQLAADNLVCLSGTLLYPDPKTGKIRKSSFAKLLEDITQRKVNLITHYDRKTTPRPDFFENEDEVNSKTADLIRQDDKPTLIINYEGVEQAYATYKSITDGLNDEEKNKIVYLPPKPSLPDELAEYNRLLQLYTVDLAENRIKAIVSSGVVGTGINIVKKNGQYPDLKVITLNMPESEIQIIQAIGRRRLTGDDFHWLISKNSMERYLSLYDQELSSKLMVLLGKIDRTLIQNMVDGADTPDKRLNVVLELLAEQRRKNAENDNHIIQYDVVFERIGKEFKNRLTRQILADALHLPKNLPREQIAERLMKTPEASDIDFVDKVLVRAAGKEFKNTEEWYDFVSGDLSPLFGLPSTLSEEIFDRLSTAPKPSSYDFISQMMIDVVFKEDRATGEDWLTTVAHNWYNANKQRVIEFMKLKYFGGQIDSGLKINLVPVPDGITVKAEPVGDKLPLPDRQRIGQPVILQYDSKGQNLNLCGLSFNNLYYLCGTGDKIHPLISTDTVGFFDFLPVQNDKTSAILVFKGNQDTDRG